MRLAWKVDTGIRLDSEHFKKMKKLLKELNACPEAIQWAGNKSWREIYDTCDRGDWLLWLFAKTNPDEIRNLLIIQAHFANEKMRSEIIIAEIVAVIVDTAIITEAASALEAANFITEIMRRMRLKKTADICRKYLPFGIWNISAEPAPADEGEKNNESTK